MGCHLRSFKEITSFYWRIIHACEEAAGKRESVKNKSKWVMHDGLQEICWTVMYALVPLLQPLKEFDNLLASEKLCQLNFCAKFREQFGTISPQKYMHWSNTLG